MPCPAIKLIDLHDVLLDRMLGISAGCDDLAFKLLSMRITRSAPRTAFSAWRPPGEVTSIRSRRRVVARFTLAAHVPIDAGGFQSGAIAD